MMFRKLAVAAAFVSTILAANYVTSRYGVWPVGFGLTATAGTYFAGLAFILRDALQDAAGKIWVALAIVAGGALSLAVGAAGIALASAVAFLLSEFADFAVYTPLRRRGYVRAALVSNMVGTVIDTVVFLALAAPTLRLFIPGFRPEQAFAGQVIGKLAITAVVVCAVLALRQARRPALT